MARIHEIKSIKLKLVIECDCGKKYGWQEGVNMKCPKCGTEHQIVLAPKSIKLPDIESGLSQSVSSIIP